jgi:hypothetical protein
MPIVLTPSNIDACRRAIEALDRCREALREMVLQYPVQCTVDGIGYRMLQNDNDVGIFRGELALALATYEAENGDLRCLTPDGKHQWWGWHPVTGAAEDRYWYARECSIAGCPVVQRTKSNLVPVGEVWTEKK